MAAWLCCPPLFIEKTMCVCVLRVQHPQQRPDAVRGPKQRGEHQPSKPLAWREKLSRPRSPCVNTEIRRPTRAAELEPKHVLVAIQCRPHPQEHATCCNSMQDRPASKTPSVGLHPAAQVRHVHSVEKRRPPQQQQQQLVPPATRRHNRRSLPHFCRRVSSGGALLSSEQTQCRQYNYAYTRSVRASYSAAHSMDLTRTLYRTSVAGFYVSRAQLISGRCFVSFRKKGFNPFSDREYCK